MLERRGVDMHEQSPVTSLLRDHGGWRIGEHRSDAVVLATGAGVRRLLAALGITLPVVTGKGCSRTFPAADSLHVATAHATLGITLAPLTGQLLADLLLDGRDPPARRAADPARVIRGQAARVPSA